MKLLLAVLSLMLLSMQAHAEYKGKLQVNVVFQSWAWHSAAKYSPEQLEAFDRNQAAWNRGLEPGDEAYVSDLVLNYNEVNTTLGFEIIGEKHGIVFGAYQDSYYTTAKYVAAIYLPYRTKYFDLGIQYGLIKSPSYLDNKLMPLFLPYMSLHVWHIGINLMYMPKFAKGGSHVLGLQAKAMF